MHNISPKHGSVLNTRNGFIRRYIVRVTSHKRKIASGVAMRGDSGVVGEGRVVAWCTKVSFMKCTMPLTNINSDWICNASSALGIIYIIYIIYITQVL